MVEYSPNLKDQQQRFSTVLQALRDADKDGNKLLDRGELLAAALERYKGKHAGEADPFAQIRKDMATIEAYSGVKKEFDAVPRGVSPSPDLIRSYMKGKNGHDAALGRIHAIINSEASYFAATLSESKAQSGAGDERETARVDRRNQIAADKAEAAAELAAQNRELAKVIGAGMDGLRKQSPKFKTPAQVADTLRMLETGEVPPDVRKQQEAIMAGLVNQSETAMRSQGNSPEVNAAIAAMAEQQRAAMGGSREPEQPAPRGKLEEQVRAVQQELAKYQLDLKPVPPTLCDIETALQKQTPPGTAQTKGSFCR